MQSITREFRNTHIKIIVPATVPNYLGDNYCLPSS